MNDEMTKSLSDDPQVAALQLARNKPAVLKAKLTRMRSAFPDKAILIFEGDDDKIVYSQWISRTRDGLDYAMMVCGGKGKCLELRNSLKEDMTGASNGVFFLIDRDFDDLRGQDPGPDIFMTDRYSVENYIVCPQVVEKCLEIEFHCNANPEIAANILAIFNKDYDEFLSVTRQTNLRIFAARRMQLQIHPIPNQLTKFCTVEIGNITKSSTPETEPIIFRGEDPRINDDLLAEFEALPPRLRYRGKIAYLFLRRWLELLSEVSRTPGNELFKGLEANGRVRSAELTLTAFAARSSLPHDFRRFVTTIPDRLAA